MIEASQIRTAGFTDLSVLPPNYQVAHRICKREGEQFYSGGMVTRRWENRMALYTKVGSIINQELPLI